MGPLCVLYLYHYKNYLRMGRSERYAISWAAASATTVLIGPIVWVGFVAIAAFAAIKAEDLSTVFPNENVYIFIISSITYLSVMLSIGGRRVPILNELGNVKLPCVTCVILIFISFGVPLILLVAGLTRFHFFAATVLMITYYAIYHFVYFDPILRRLTVR